VQCPKRRTSAATCTLIKGMNETPVFVAEHPWRRRALGAAVAAGGALLLAWLVAVVIGALGFGSLPAVPFGNDDQSKTASEQSAKPAAPTHVAKKHSSSAAAQPNGSKENRANGSGSRSSSQSGSATGGSGSATGGSGSATGGSGGHHAAATISPTVSPGTSGSGAVNAHGANPNAGGTNAGGNSATAGGGKPTSTPSGTAPGAYAHGANPNAGGANSNRPATGTGTTTTG
jgi:hypothetical protein